MMTTEIVYLADGTQCIYVAAIPGGHLVRPYLQDGTAVKTPVHTLEVFEAPPVHLVNAEVEAARQELARMNEKLEEAKRALAKASLGLTTVYKLCPEFSKLCVAFMENPPENVFLVNVTSMDSGRRLNLSIIKAVYVAQEFRVRVKPGSVEVVTSGSATIADVCVGIEEARRAVSAIAKAHLKKSEKNYVEFASGDVDPEVRRVADIRNAKRNKAMAEYNLALREKQYAQEVKSYREQVAAHEAALKKLEEEKT